MGDIRSAPRALFESDGAPPFFWLHIKKAAGSSVRQLLGSLYPQVQRSGRPVNFAQCSVGEANDVLNNFRIPLGDYQFRRCLFARRFLFGECWETMYRFAFCREPVSRSVSAYFYLKVARGPNRSFLDAVPSKDHGRNDAVLFDAFLDVVAAQRESDSVYEPVDLHFSTHTAAVHPDVVDDDGALMLNDLYRVECLMSALNTALSRAGLDARIDDQPVFKNANRTKPDFTPTREHRKKIEQLYREDFELYEAATVVH